MLAIKTRPFPCAGVSALAMAMVSATVPAYAGDAAAAAASPGDALSEIVVTAQKRPENLQTVPIAISSISGGALQDRHAQSLLDLGDGAIPSLRVDPFFSRPSALIINIRGIGVLSDSTSRRAIRALVFILMASIWVGPRAWAPRYSTLKVSKC